MAPGSRAKYIARQQRKSATLKDEYVSTVGIGCGGGTRGPATVSEGDEGWKSCDASRRRIFH